MTLVLLTDLIQCCRPRLSSSTLPRHQRSSSTHRHEIQLSCTSSSIMHTTEEGLIPRQLTEKRKYWLPLMGRKSRDQVAWVDGPDLLQKQNFKDPVQLEDWLQQNLTRLQLVFLGTSSRVPSKNRSLPSLAVRAPSEIWLFDVGEDTQRQCMKHPLMRPRRISRIYLTSLDLDVCHGLPGVLCAIASSRAQGSAVSDIPVHLYGPQGTASFICKLMELSNTSLEMPVVIYEFSKEPHNELENLADRAKLWKKEIPPDELNADGFSDVHLDATRPLKRNLIPLGKRYSQTSSVDGRAGLRAFKLPLPGDPSAYPLSSEKITWTLKLNEEFMIKVYPLDEEATSLGYRIIEADRSGNLDVAKAISLGVEPGADFGILKRGGKVETKAGDVIDPEVVVSPDRKGRVLTIVGQCSDLERCLTPSLDTDCLILPIGRNPTDQSKGFTQEQALELAARSRAGTLIFSRVESTDEETMMSIADRKETNISVHCACDFLTYVLQAN